MAETQDKTHLEDLIVDLRKVPAFSDLPRADLEWFVSHAEESRVDAGQIFVKEGTTADKMFVFLEGEIRGRRESGGPGGAGVRIQAPAGSRPLSVSRVKGYSIAL